MKPIITFLFGLMSIYGLSQSEVDSTQKPHTTNNHFSTGNYGSATASKIKAYDESFSFMSGWKWLSFPRMERYKDGIFDSKMLLSRIKPWDSVTPENLYMEYNPTGFDWSISYNNVNGWEQDPTLVNLRSTQGYKLNYEGETDFVTIRMEGAKEDYETSMDLVAGENWVGYFLDESYYPEQCLPPELWEVLEQIKTQNWTMTKKPFSEPP
ncbi:MAG: hypothetical protein K8S16_11990 [Bacteroidales bacterium]|nr:hypothetical protein [Bacteroidales bacterium]